jgi:SRSO17 transposase
MGHDLDNAARERLQGYIDTLGRHLKDRRKRESFAIYAAGVLGSAERKSVEPMASLASGDAATSRHMHDKLLHFVGGSQWSDAAVRLEATRHVCQALARRMSHKELVRTIKERWRTERMYEDLKDELGLDHFEGRSFRGWHHHVSVVICCYAFVVAERMRAFPPSTRGESIDRTLSVAA